MKINSNVPSIGTSQAGGRAKQPAQATQTPTATAGEKVALSSLSARLQEATATLADTPVVNVTHVAEIKKAMSEGRFQINPERIADGLLENVRQMLLAKQR